MSFPVGARTTGELVTAAIWNADLKDNLNNLYAGALALTSQAIGDMLVATSTTQLGRLVGSSVTGNMQDAVLQRPEFKDYAETLVTLVSALTVSIDFEAGNNFQITMAHNVTFSFLNPPATGKLGSFTLFAKQDGTGSRVPVWPASVKWPANIAPTLTTTAGKEDIFGFSTRDAGTVYDGFINGLTY
jgi:hypothetical protein